MTPVSGRTHRRAHVRWMHVERGAERRARASGPTQSSRQRSQVGKRTRRPEHAEQYNRADHGERPDACSGCERVSTYRPYLVRVAGAPQAFRSDRWTLSRYDQHDFSPAPRSASSARTIRLIPAGAAAAARPLIGRRRWRHGDEPGVAFLRLDTCRDRKPRRRQSSRSEARHPLSIEEAPSRDHQPRRGWFCARLLHARGHSRSASSGYGAVRTP